MLHPCLFSLLHTFVEPKLFPGLSPSYFWHIFSNTRVRDVQRDFPLLFVYFVSLNSLHSTSSKNFCKPIKLVFPKLCLLFLCVSSFGASSDCKIAVLWKKKLINQSILLWFLNPFHYLELHHSWSLLLMRLWWLRYSMKLALSLVLPGCLDPWLLPPIAIFSRILPQESCYFRLLWKFAWF